MIIRAFRGVAPRIAESAFIADDVVVIGDVEIGEFANIWYGAVLRGDVGYIRIGARSNVQDAAVIHMTTAVSNAIIGEEVTIGHGAIIHGATVEDGALVGMGSVLLDNAVIGSESLIAAGTVVPPRMAIPPRSLVRGRPGRVLGAVSEAQRQEGRRGAHHYLDLAAEHRKEMERERLGGLRR